MEAHSITLMNKTEDDELGNEELSEEELRGITGWSSSSESAQTQKTDRELLF